MNPLQGNKDEKSISSTYGEKSKSFIQKYPVIFTIIISLITIVCVYYWKDYQAKKQKEAIEQMATVQLMQNNIDMLKLLSKPLVWSIRSEMLRGNLEQVNIYTNDMVKAKNFQFIYLISPGDSMIISTDKKFQGQNAKGMFDDKSLHTDSLVAVNDDNKSLTVFAPVMGYDSRLATLVYRYTPVKFLAGEEK
ncbi:MAG: hypothetical protein ABI472_08230 [Ginsengibacter sp.]